MHKILVPIDGSDHSLKALHIACDLAHKYRAIVSLLYVLANDKLADEFLNLPIAKQFTPELQAKLQNAGEDTSEPLCETLIQDAGNQILKIAAKRAERLGIDTEIMPLAKGDPADNILAAHKLTGASTIVMGSRGGRWSTLSSFGSVSNKVFATAECTCISVK